MPNSSLGMNCLLTELLLGCEKQMKHILTYNPAFRMFIWKVSCCSWTKAPLIQQNDYGREKCVHIHRKLQAVEKMQKEHWPSSVHNVNYCQSLRIFPPFLSTPEAILHHRRKRGVPLCKWTVARKRSLPHLHRFTFTTLIHQWTEEMYMRKDESKGKSLLSTSCCLCCFC